MVESDADAVVPVVGDCGYTTKMNGTDQVAAVQREFLAPICLALKQDTNETKWVTQTEYKDFVGAEDSFCLKGGSNRNECFVKIYSVCVVGGPVCGSI